MVLAINMLTLSSKRIAKSGNSYVRYADANLATKHVFYMRLHCRNAGMICGRQALARKRGVIGWPFLC
jgi:hypothetical protein